MAYIDHYPILIKNYRGFFIRKANDDNDRYCVFAQDKELHFSSSVIQCEWWIDGWYKY